VALALRRGRARPLIGAPEGTASADAEGRVEIIALRPTREDFILKMQRGAQVVYPKDQAMIVGLADIRPGMRVVEAGAGSGALTLALLDAVGPEGSVHSVERREDHAVDARRNVERFHGGPGRELGARVGDVADVLATTTAHRVVLDLPEPWHALDGAARARARRDPPHLPAVGPAGHGGHRGAVGPRRLHRRRDLRDARPRLGRRRARRASGAPDGRAHRVPDARAAGPPTRDEGGPRCPGSAAWPPP
jgi:hypothetical protein